MIPEQRRIFPVSGEEIRNRLAVFINPLRFSKVWNFEGRERLDRETTDLPEDRRSVYTPDKMAAVCVRVFSEL